MRPRATAVSALILALAGSLSACGDAQDPAVGRTYASANVTGFRPEDGKFSFEEPIVMTAGESWQENWPGALVAEVDPTSCLDFLGSIEMLRASDEEESAADSVAYYYGFAGAFDGGDEFPVSVYAIARAFASPSVADEHIAELRSNATPCADGYSYELEGLAWSAGSIVVGDRSVGGVPDVLVVDELDVVFGPSGDPQSTVGADHYTHYVLARGNGVLVASFVFDGDAVTDEDAADLIGQFIAHLGADE